MKKRIFLALLLAVSLLLTGCGGLMTAMESLMTGLQSQGYPDDENYTLPFSRIRYVRPDLEEYRQLLDEACHLGETSTDAGAVMEAVYALYDAYDWFSTMYYLADLHYSMDLTDSFYQAEYEYCGEQLAFMDSSMETLYVSLAQSPVLDTLESEDYFGEGFFDPYKAPEGSGEDWEYESLWDDTLLSLSNRESELTARYYEAQQDMPGLEPGSQAYRDWCLENLGSILVELIQVRQEIAAHLGYDSAEDYVSDWYYGRSETPEQIEAYARDIREYLVPLYIRCRENMDWDSLYAKTRETDCLDYVKTTAKNMGDIVQEACDQMISRELYDISPSPNKAAGSYEIYLVSFDAPFILVNPWQDRTDLLTVVHEFGHFVNDYATWGTYASADVTEVLSQGMEYLSLEYSGSLSQTELELLTQYAMISSLSTYVEQMVYYTFEQRAYALEGDGLTAEALCALYDEIVREFGYGETEDMEWYDYEWTEVPHFYQYPFYVYSYIVSNDAAMQIYAMELEEEGAGLELYLEFVYEWEDLPLTEYLEYYGLKNPLAPGRVEELAEIFREKLNLD